VISFVRRAKDPADFVLVVVNFTPVARPGYPIGVPEAGRYRELLNSDAAMYGGSNTGNAGGVTARAEPADGLPYSLDLFVPPLGCVFLKR
jgi:1,4-alpha-glucan branching enzyme